jgi:hypothetical protein
MEVFRETPGVWLNVCPVIGQRITFDYTPVHLGHSSPYYHQSPHKRC